MRDHSYPFYAQGFFYVNRKPGQPLDAKVDEFVRFVLSRQGQECVQQEGRYLPLTAGIVQAQLKKID